MNQLQNPLPFMVVIWGRLTNQEITKWDKHQIETPHTEFCKKYSVYNVKHKIMDTEPN